MTFEPVERREQTTTKQKKEYLFCKDAGSAHDCPSVKRIIKILNFYQQLPKNLDCNALNEKILECFTENSTIINDYHHIVLQHISSPDKQQDNLNFSVISNLLYKTIICDLANCEKYKRNQRGRYIKIKGDEYAEEKLMNETFKLVNPKTKFYRQFLDSMHCYFIHAFDSGRRVQLQTPTGNHFDEDNLADKSQLAFDDKQMKQLAKALGPSKDSSMHQFNKFATEITDDSLQEATGEVPDELFLDELMQHMKQQKVPLSIIELFYTQLMTEQYDSDVLMYETENNMLNADVLMTNMNYYYTVVDYVNNKTFSSSTTLYSFGLRYYYWYPYKHHYWYVPKKYKDFKEEMLHTKKGISKDTWEIVLQKATSTILQSDEVKSLKSNDKKYAYGIENGLSIQCEHIMAVSFYTDTTEDSYEFSKSFRKILNDTCDEDTKKRNMEYREWSRLLREAVECFGTKMEQSKISVFYHGVSMIYFVSFIAKFRGPTSTTASIEIATRFADENGIILDLEKALNGGQLKYFNVSYLSQYDEEECIFIGGEYPLQFKSIHNMVTHEDYEQIMMPLSLFDKVISAAILSTQSIGIQFEAMVGNMHALIQHEIKEKENNYPEYINTCFKSLVNNRKILKFNVSVMQNCSTSIGKIFMSEEYSDYFENDFDNNLLAFDYIANLFKQCEEIYSLKTDPTRQVFDGQNWLYLDELMSMLIRINTNKRCNLRRIRICGKNDLNQNVEMYEKYKLWIKDTTEWNLDIAKRDSQLILSRS